MPRRREDRGEFSLATREELLKGGASGKAIELRKSSESLLVRLISHEDEPLMPEDGAKLDQRQIDAIAKWIDLGAPYDKPLLATEDAIRLLGPAAPSKTRRVISGRFNLCRMSSRRRSPTTRGGERRSIASFSRS